MINEEILRTALEAIIAENEQTILLSPICDLWDCPLCGRSYLKIFCATEETPYDLILWNTHDGGGWQVLEATDPDAPLICDCTNAEQEA